MRGKLLFSLVFGHKQKYCAIYIFDLKCGEWSKKVQRSGSDYNSSCAKFHGYPSNSFGDFTQNRKCKPHGGARWTVRGWRKVTGIHPLGTLKVFTQFYGNPSSSFWNISLKRCPIHSCFISRAFINVTTHHDITEYLMGCKSFCSFLPSGTDPVWSLTSH